MVVRFGKRWADNDGHFGVLALRSVEDDSTYLFLLEIY